MGQIVFVLFVDEGLEVLHLDHGPCARFDQRVDLHRVVRVLGQHFLNFVVVEQLILSKAEYFKCLLFGYKTALDPETFFSDALAADVSVRGLLESLVQFLKEVASDLG